MAADQDEVAGERKRASAVLKAGEGAQEHGADARVERWRAVERVVARRGAAIEREEVEEEEDEARARWASWASGRHGVGAAMVALAAVECAQQWWW